LTVPKAGYLSQVRVVLADDHQTILEKLTRLLEPEYEIVGTAGDGQSLVATVTQLRPEVLITDISMPISTGIEAVSKLRDSGCPSKVVFLTVHDDPDYVRACLATGASGYVLKARMLCDLPHAIREALEGRVFVSPLTCGPS
jgi:DNA-binding NarL/FixJ family response regulator